MFRKTLAPDKGMLFIFDTEKTISIWMKNTYIPLDLIWINQQLDIVHLVKNATPLNERIYRNPIKAMYLLEVAGGTIDQLNLNRYEKVQFNASLRNRNR